MGTLVYRSTKAEAVRRELADLQGHSTLLASRLIGPRLWYLAERNGVRWIGLTLIRTQGTEVAVKHLDESMGPYHFDCPLSYLKRASAPQGSYAQSWREKVRAFHAKRGEERVRRVNARPGQRVQLKSDIFELQESWGRRGWVVRQEGSGALFRMKCRQISQVEWLPAAPSDVPADPPCPPPPTAGPSGPEHPPS